MPDIGKQERHGLYPLKTSMSSGKSLKKALQMKDKDTMRDNFKVTWEHLAKSK